MPTNEPTSKPKSAALILAGAVARGAFEAGALQVIAGAGIPVRRIVAASSGALNGAAYAAGVRARREVDAARELVELWQHHSSWRDVFSLNLTDVVGMRGLFDQQKLLSLLRQNVRPCAADAPAPIDLHIVLAPVHGIKGQIDVEEATTYERVLGFEGDRFDSEEGLDAVFEAAAATSAFPGVFAPATVKTEGLGPCFDGGVVNNTPIDSALDDGKDDEIDTVFVIAPNPLRFTAPAEELRGQQLISQLVDMLINERLYRDLRRAHGINVTLDKLEALAKKKGWSDEELDEIKEAVDLAGRRRLQIVQIRPDPRQPLPGDAFSGFFHPDHIKQYIDVGGQRAAAALEQRGWR